jgi:hypothetical protein
VLSFAKIDLIYLFKSISLPAVSILLLFCVGMEMYAEIEKGIRIPKNMQVQDLWPLPSMKISICSDC